MEFSPSLYIEVSAVVVGGLSGALHAVRKGFDAVGVIAIALATALGGGMLRDMLLGQGPVLALVKPRYFAAALAASLGGLLFGSLLKRLATFLVIIDALTIGLFTVMGAQRGIAINLAFTPEVFLGVITSVGGGVLRDVLCNETPQILLPGELYATPALLAALVYVGGVRHFGVTPLLAELAAVVLAFLLRVLSVWRGWKGPPPVDLVKDKAAQRRPS